VTDLLANNRAPFVAVYARTYYEVRCGVDWRIEVRAILDGSFKYAPPMSHSLGELADDPSLRDDYIEGAAPIATFLGPGWNERRVYRARETGALPIRRKSGIGIYAFRSELTAALRDPATLPILTMTES